MGVEPIRMAMSDAFTNQLDSVSRSNAMNEARLSLAGIKSAWGDKANKELLKAQMSGQGGFNWGSALSLGASVLGAAKGAGLFGGGGGGGGSLGSSFTSKNFEMPSFMSGAGNFSSFWNG